MRLRCFLAPPANTPPVFQILPYPEPKVPPLPSLRFGQSTNILLFAHKHIYRVWVWFSFRLFQVRTRKSGKGLGSWRTAPTGVLFHPFACQKLCKYVYHFHLPGDSVHLALSKQTIHPAERTSVSCAHILGLFSQTHLSLNRWPRVLR